MTLWLPAGDLESLRVVVEACRRCPRLVAYRRRVAERRVRRFRDQEYWGTPVAGFGDPAARLLIVGLAPAAHGANRASYHPNQRNTQTGLLTPRMFARILDRAGRLIGKEKLWRSLTDPTSAV